MKSLLAEKIQAALAYRQSLGKSTKSYAPYLRNLDAFCAENYPGRNLSNKGTCLGLGSSGFSHKVR